MQTRERYASVDELRQSLGGHDRDEQDIATAIDAASQLIADRTGRQFGKSGPQPREIRIVHDFPTVDIGDLFAEIETVEYAPDWESAKAGRWIVPHWEPVHSAFGTVEAVRIDRPYCHGRHTHQSLGRWGHHGPGWLRVKPTHGWGFPTVPDPIKQATMLHAAKLMKRRETPEGVYGWEGSGLLNVDRKGIDGDAAALISPFTRTSWWIG